MDGMTIEVLIKALWEVESLWCELLRKRSYPRDRRTWPEKWNDRLKGLHPDGMITDQEFRAYYKSHRGLIEPDGGLCLFRLSVSCT
jgi:hypothetical protein